MEYKIQGFNVKVNDNVSDTIGIINSLEALKEKDFDRMKNLLIGSDYYYIFYIDNSKEMGFYSSIGNYVLQYDNDELIMTGAFKKYKESLNDLREKWNITEQNDLFFEDEQKLKEDPVLKAIKSTVFGQILSSDFAVVPVSTSTRK